VKIHIFCTFEIHIFQDIERHLLRTLKKYVFSVLNESWQDTFSRCRKYLFSRHWKYVFSWCWNQLQFWFRISYLVYILFNLYLTRPFVRCPMGLPITVSCDTAWIRTTVSVVTPQALRCSALDHCATRSLVRSRLDKIWSKHRRLWLDQIWSGPDQKSISVDIEIKVGLDRTKSEPNIDAYDWFRFGPDRTKNQCPWMWKSRSVRTAPKQTSKRHRHPSECNSIILNRPLAHTRARTRDLLHTTTTVTHEASLPIAPQKPRPLQSKGKYYFKVSEQVT
jgi:hypothetical protein